MILSQITCFVNWLLNSLKLCYNTSIIKIKQIKNMKLRYLSGIFVSVIVLGIFCLSAPLTRAAYGDVTTFASEPYWGDGYNATEAFLDFPEGLCRDSDGNFYVADTYNNVIRKIKSDGKIITLAGSGSYGMTDAKGAAAEFAMPRGVAVDSNEIGRAHV